MKKLKTYNESVKDYLKSKISKEEILKKVMEQPTFARWDYIMDNQLEEVFNEEELKKFEDELIYVDYSDYKLMYAEKNNKRYYIIRMEGEEGDENENYNMIIFDDNWDKITDDDYEAIKYVVEIFKLRME